MTRQDALMPEAEKLGFFKGVKVKWWGTYTHTGYESGTSVIVDIFYSSFTDAIKVKLENGKEFTVASSRKVNVTLSVIPDYLPYPFGV